VTAAVTGAPPAPSRVRMIRPQFYRSALTGSLAPDVRDLLLGLTTLCDDEGYMLWEPAEIASYLYSYQSAGRRLRDLEHRAQILMAHGLIDVKPCGCAYLPTLKEHHGIKGGKPTSPIWTWHQRHPNVDERGTTWDHDTVSVSVSVSGSVLDSSSGSVSETPGARATNGAALDEAAPSPALVICDGCGQPTTDHTLKCPNAPWMRPVAPTGASRAR
jgi:hypothetical protein